MTYDSDPLGVNPHNFDYDISNGENSYGLLLRFKHVVSAIVVCL